MSPDNNLKFVLPKELEDYADKLPEKERNLFWQRVSREIDQFTAMSTAEQEVDLLKIDREAALADQRIKLLEMKPEEREKELKRLEAEAKKAGEEAEAEWREAVAAAAAILVEEDVARRDAEAEAIKKFEAEKEDNAFEILKAFAADSDLAGCGAVLKTMATGGRIGEVLNYFGYTSNLSGMHSFFNEVIIGHKPIVGERAFDNFVFQQEAYALENDISCLAEGLNQWNLAFAVGRKDRAWYQLSDEEHLLVLFWRLKGISPEKAARHFGLDAYCYVKISEKFDLSAEKEFIFGDEGKLILIYFEDSFTEQLKKNDFNSEAAIFLAENAQNLREVGLKQSLVEALDKYAEFLKTKPEAADYVLEALQ